MNRRRGVTIVELLVIIAIIAFLIALLLPATRYSRPAAYRSWCSNNLKGIALALAKYETDHGVLPPAYTVDAQGRPLHSWRTLILPYLEQEPLYASINLSQPWDDPSNGTALAARPSVYMCPTAFADDRGPGNLTTYVACVGPTDRYLLPFGRSRRLDEITDGTDHTLAVIEIPRPAAVPWISPLDATDALVLSLGHPNQPPLPHTGGFNAAFADGSVRFLKTTTSEAVRRKLLTINGGETLSNDEF
jgi:prepilin-type processing-associated H-X9-DG protein